MNGIIGMGRERDGTTVGRGGNNALSTNKNKFKFLIVLIM
jgi:hypothetical protein